MLLVVTACSGGGGKALPTPKATPTCPSGGQVLPARCVSTVQPSDDPFPSDASKIEPVALAAPREKQTVLGSADNSTVASTKTATFTVTVPAGARIGSEMICLGNGQLTVSTAPKSDAFQSFKCNNGQGLPSELAAESAHPVKAATSYTVTVTASGVSRWAVRVYSTTEQITVAG